MIAIEGKGEKKQVLTNFDKFASQVKFGQYDFKSDEMTQIDKSG